MSDLTNKMNDIIGIDFQGWPMYKRTLREILTFLNFKETVDSEGNVIFKAPSEKILDIFPQVMEDDGMGYMVNEQYITDAWISEDDKNIVISAEPYNKEEVDNWKKDLKN